MTREKRLASIFKEFDRSATQFSADTKGLYSEIDFVCKGNDEDDPQKLKFRFARIYYNAYIAEFKYTAHTSMNVTSSILECLIHIDKSPDGIAIPLPLFLDYCGISTLSPMYIPLISTPEDMRQAFSVIADILCTHQSAIEEHCGAPRGREHLRQAFFEDLVRVLALKKDPIADQEEIYHYITPVLYDFFTIRFTSVHFLNLIKGDKISTIKQLSKLKPRFGYETRLLSLLEHTEIPTPPQLSHIREMLTIAYTKGGTQKQSGKEFFAMFLSWLILTAVLFPAYGALYALLQLWEGNGALYLLHSAANIAYSFLFAFLTAIAASYFLRFRIFKCIYKKHYENQLALDHVQNGSGADRLLKGLLHLIVIAALVGSLLLAKWNLKFTEEGFIDNSSFFTFSGEFHSYNEIDCVYYKPDRVNGLGETIEFPSYVLRLKNGTEIDFYQISDIEEYTPKLLDLLREKSIPIDETAKPITK